MGVDLFVRKRNAPPRGQRLRAANCGRGSKSQANPPRCWRVKYYPNRIGTALERLERRQPVVGSWAKAKIGGIGMYIGLGGLLILILVLWLLGVI
jgi:hypothetical protein